MVAKRQAKQKEFTNNTYKSLTAKNSKQKEYMQAIEQYDIVIASGSAGTGKTAIAVHYASTKLLYNQIERIIVTRPAIEAAGEELGFVPGTLEEKMANYLVPCMVLFQEYLGESFVENLVKNGRIVGVPMAYMRGRTFENAIIIADEMQNSTPDQMELLTTRIGSGSKLLINGDSTQSDISGENGLDVANKYLQWIPQCKTIEFKNEHIVRHQLISDIIQSFAKYKKDRK